MISLNVYLVSNEENDKFRLILEKFLGTDVTLFKIEKFPDAEDIIADFRFMCEESSITGFMDAFLDEELKEFLGIKYKVIGFSVLDYGPTQRYVMSSIFWHYKTFDLHNANINKLMQENKRLSEKLTQTNDRLLGVMEELRSYRQIPTYYSILKEICDILDCEELMENVTLYRIQ
jgi:hypothetical protein